MVTVKKLAKLCGVIDEFDCNGCASFSKFRGCLVMLRKKEFQELLNYEKIIVRNDYDKNKNVVIEFGKTKK